MIKGTNASPGVAIGKALLLKEEEVKISKSNNITVKDEIQKLNESVEKSKVELNKIKEKVSNEIGEEEAQIFESHLMVLEDPELLSTTINKIENEKVNADYALNEVANNFITIFESMDNEYMKERAADIKDVTGRVLKHILGIKSVDLSFLDGEYIIVSHDLTPSQTAVMDKKSVTGFLTNIGGRTSHSAIMARTLEIPAVVGLKNVTETVKDGDVIVFNGDTGEVVINPDAETYEEFKKMKVQFEQEKEELKKMVGVATKTIDNRHVELAANIGTPNDIEGVIKNDGEGVGLYRTEFLYMDRSNFPNEEEQFIAYKSVLEGMKGKPVVIRTLDIGGDKELDYLKLPKEMNPFLGYRAIRLCLDRVDIFKTQLRALLRASIYGKLRIMFPMISSLEELLSAKEILEECRQELNNEGIKTDNNIEIGMMIEVPSAALISDILAKHVDFFSIGTNDLIQYTTAVDRMNEKIHNLYNMFNPAVLRLIKLVIDNAHKEGKWVGMCGEAAGDSKMIPILLGFGLDEFSMSAISILKARKQINNLSFEEMKEFSDKILTIGSAEEIEKEIKAILK
ncbi:phosphoenolpyruvate--protein phosphotransferase [Oceanirhabdus sp. W0125-5]|uniref:phosphoenolpyruvate--protein phosphotransferase n=1 Tax=Oceanirhabdus sp. W0125-5 TaxID=2999116 RepID=UPI0022F3241F|nr:phosphoenolpyruvate--protein phosphotransferase [Oceanirhabdus sp. W0125-5]WBW94759.1 phosphoenolpyruvate--protein phosphotransferase [Oceanirhabdus sp. W0125-5]